MASRRTCWNEKAWFLSPVRDHLTSASGTSDKRHNAMISRTAEKKIRSISCLIDKYIIMKYLESMFFLRVTALFFVSFLFCWELLKHSQNDVCYLNVFIRLRLPSDSDLSSQGVPRPVRDVIQPVYSGSFKDLTVFLLWTTFPQRHSEGIWTT